LIQFCKKQIFVCCQNLTSGLRFFSFLALYFAKEQKLVFKKTVFKKQGFHFSSQKILLFFFLILENQKRKPNRDFELKKTKH